MSHDTHTQDELDSTSHTSIGWGCLHLTPTSIEGRLLAALGVQSWLWNGQGLQIRLLLQYTAEFLQTLQQTQV